MSKSKPKPPPVTSAALPEELQRLITEINLIEPDVCLETAAQWPVRAEHEYVRGVIKDAFMRKVAVLRAQYMKACDAATDAQDFELADKLHCEVIVLRSLLALHIGSHWKTPPAMDGLMVAWEVRRNFVVVCFAQENDLPEIDVDLEDDESMTSEDEDAPDDEEDENPPPNKRLH